MLANSGASAWRARQAFVAHVTTAMAQALHEPNRYAQRLAIAHMRHLRDSERSTKRTLAQLRAGQLPALPCGTRERARIDAFISYLTDEPAAKVVVAAHMAGFVRCVIKLLLQIPAGMHVQVPIPQRSAAALAVLTAVARERGVTLRLLPIERGALPPAAVASQRSSITFTMIDLDGTYGRSDAVTFLGAPAHLVIGPYVLARRRRASIVYVDCCDGELSFDPPHSACVFEAPSSAHLLHRFAARIERSVRANPAQWMRWHTLAALRRPPAPC